MVCPLLSGRKPDNWAVKDGPETLRIRAALTQVSREREAVMADPKWASAVMAIKQLQCARFAHTYADLLSNPRFGPATQFFLTDLYAPRDFAERDAQFGRISGAIERFFDASVAATAWALADVHGLSERLDAAVAKKWLDSGTPLTPTSYLLAWRQVGEHDSRVRQLQTVLSLGQQLDHHTRTRGLRMLLKLMRGPAAAAGLSDLQRFLENGFDAFSSMKGAKDFLVRIETTEAALISDCFDAPMELALRHFEGISTHPGSPTK